MLKKSLSLLLSFLLFVSAGVMPIYACAASTFAYEHDPRQNAAAMADIVADENAIYGFRPSEAGSLKNYASADWSDPAVVEAGRQERIAYHQSIASMYTMLEAMQAEGKSTEEIARAVSTRRNELRLASYRDDPQGLATVKARNLEKYGHEEGPLPDELYAQYGSWETVIAKAFSANVGMDACLGLYDDYFALYVALGQVEAPTAAPTLSPKTGDESRFVLWAVVMLAIVGALAVAAGKPRKKTQV